MSASDEVAQDARPTDAEIVAALIALRRTHPDMRLGQLLCSVAVWAGRLERSGVWDMEDSEFVATAHRHLYENPHIMAPARVHITIQPEATNA
jgi:hypothetical protein